MRFTDPLCDRLDPLVEDLLPTVLARGDAPIVLFGHSLGALVAFELGRRLAARHRIFPRHLIVSALRAPHLPKTGVPEHTLPEAEFRARLREFNGTPEEVLTDDTMMKVVGPILRADLAIPATYMHPPGARVTWPITAFAGLDDTEAPPDDVGAWREETTGEFALRVLPDGHFFLHSQEGTLLRELAGQRRGETVVNGRARPHPPGPVPRPVHDPARLDRGQLMTSQQVGSLIGIALLGAIVGAGTGVGATVRTSGQEFADGMHRAFLVAGLAFLAGALIAVVFTRDPSPRHRPAMDVPRATTR